MGSCFRATCSCGYVGEAQTGATRATYLHSFFYPYACAACRDVVSVELAAKKPTCPSCKSTEVIAYGHELPKSKHKLWELLARLLTLFSRGSSKESAEPVPHYINQSTNFLSNRTWGLTRGPHLCPSCGNRSLYFALTALYD